MTRLAALVLLLPSFAFAEDTPYRSLELTDGRTLVAEVLSTEATGLRMRTPQGEMLVPFELLVDISPSTKDVYDQQPSLRVWLYAPEHERVMRAAYESIPNLIVSSEKNPRGLPPGQVIQLEQCGADFDCMAESVASDTWMWLVSALPPSDESDAVMILRGRTSGGPPVLREDVESMDANGIWSPAHRVVGLLADGGPSKELKWALDPKSGASDSPKNDPKKPPKPPGDGNKKAVPYTLAGVGIGAAALGVVGFLAGGGLDKRDDAKFYAIGMGAAGGLVGGLAGHSLSKPSVGVQARIGRKAAQVRVTGTF